jgi:hypothetical protein
MGSDRRGEDRTDEMGCLDHIFNLARGNTKDNSPFVSRKKLGMTF